MQFQQLSKFSKEFKKLKKKYKSLDKDLKTLQAVIVTFPEGNGSRHWNRLQSSGSIVIYKVRMQCAYLKRKSFRVIYAYNCQAKEIEFIEFIEIYFKGDKPREDKDRISEYLQN
jgi:mRNA-degrading endonuclease RelE of RelBE toxin-antitoxin system